MPNSVRRPLTQGECARVSPGLMLALEKVGAAPSIVRRAHPGALAAGLWRGAVPILTRGRQIFWPRAPADLAQASDRALAVLQHELQHVLDYATGDLSAFRYLLRPRNWRYGYELTPASRWSSFGAEQRASLAEHFWLLERGRSDLVARDLRREPADIELYRRIIPWAEGRLERGPPET